MKLYDNIVDLDDGKKNPYHYVNATEEDYDRVDAIIEKMNLTKKQSAILERYINNDRLTDISIELNISTSSICNTRKRIQQKYMDYIFHFNN